jgi:hypothetical protein
MSKPLDAGRRLKYRLELGRQFGRKCAQNISRLEDKSVGRPDIASLYKVVRTTTATDVMEMTDETLGRIVATIPEGWGRRSLALLKLCYPLEKPTASITGREFQEELAGCAIFGAVMDFLRDQE